jgi:hypothetical protein
MNITSKVHKFVEWAEKSGVTVFAMPARQWVSEAIIFNCGQAEELPPRRTETLPKIIKAPFKKTILEFSMVSGFQTKHDFIIFIDSQLPNLEEIQYPERSFFIQLAMYNPHHGFECYNYSFVTLLPGNKEFIYEDTFLIDADKSDHERLVGILSCANQWAAHIFRLLRCKNVVTVDNPAPAALNKKRIAAGKVPIFSHKTLHLHVPIENQKSTHQGGTHASPRIHLRRGHIRTLSDDREIWVNEAVVGKKHGIVHKDYQLHSAAP